MEADLSHVEPACKNTVEAKASRAAYKNRPSQWRCPMREHFSGAFASKMVVLLGHSAMKCHNTMATEVASYRLSSSSIEVPFHVLDSLNEYSQLPPLSSETVHPGLS
jgi:hypothetical protein